MIHCLLKPTTGRQENQVLCSRSFHLGFSGSTVEVTNKWISASGTAIAADQYRIVSGHDLPAGLLKELARQFGPEKH
jgi:hypothetical protein